MINPNDDYYREILKEFTPLFKDAIEIEIQLGNNIAIEDAKNKGKKTRDSGLKVSKTDINNFMKKLELNIKDANRDISKRISNAILENTSQRGSLDDLTKKIKQIFEEDTSEHFNYKNRYRTIARTESTTILNTSARNKAKSLGAKKKYMVGVNDKRQGEDSKVALAKYGSEEQAIDIDKPFEYTVNGKEYSYLLPPNRPSDREIVLYVW